MNKNKILLVDDELKLRDTITELLIYNNYVVKTAENGYAALNILESWIPDLIISDIMMPIMDGYSFHEIVRESALLNQIPFVFLTAKNDTIEMVNSTINGVDLFITKPFKISDLLKMIKVKIERFDKIKESYSNFSINKNNYFLEEINKPIVGILNSLEIIIENKDHFDNREIEDLYKSIKKSGNRLNRTLKNSIIYENLKTNKIDFSEDLHSEMSSSFYKIKDDIVHNNEKQAKRITFNIEKAKIKIKDENLRFILFELIDNALKFSKMNQKVIITGKKFNSEYYELCIKDFGDGFSLEELKTIELNQNLIKKKSDKQGLGLGLFISKTFVKKINGVFSIISIINEGTTISLYLPLYAGSKQLNQIETIKI
jgi:two-component system sensor histidine kinase/response regulator